MLRILKKEIKTKIIKFKLIEKLCQIKIIINMYVLLIKLFKILGIWNSSSYPYCGVC
jgi:hypothetical protein